MIRALFNKVGDVGVPPYRIYTEKYIKYEIASQGKWWKCHLFIFKLDLKRALQNKKKKKKTFALVKERLHDLLEKDLIFSFLTSLILWFTPFQSVNFFPLHCVLEDLFKMCVRKLTRDHQSRQHIAWFHLLFEPELL